MFPLFPYVVLKTSWTRKNQKHPCHCLIKYTKTMGEENNCQEKASINSRLFSSNNDLMYLLLRLLTTTLDD